MNKRFFSLLMTVVLCCTFVGCGKNENSENNNSTTVSTIQSYDNGFSSDTDKTSNEKSKETSNEENTEIQLSENSTESSTVEESKIESSSDDNNTTDTVSSDFKETMDSYEAFFDEYIDFMKKFDNNPSDLTLLNEYSKYMTNYTECMNKLNSIEINKLSTADHLYYTEVNLRISKKLDEYNNSKENTDNTNISSLTEEVSENTVVSAEFKKTMDDYEAFFDEYIDFMKKFDENPSDAKLILDYAKYTAKYTKIMHELDSIDTDKLSTADTLYYTEVNLRISQKLSEIS